MDALLQRLDQIERLIQSQGLVQKTVLNFNEACDYLELSPSFLYKLTSSATITHYKPNGKKIYFNRAELDVWLQQNRQATKAELEMNASNYLTRKTRRG